MPSSALTQLRDLIGTGALSKDEIVDLPGNVDTAAGSWTAVVAGFDIPTGTDKFELRVSLDGNVVKIR